jgi:hypothetical protein
MMAKQEKEGKMLTAEQPLTRLEQVPMSKQFIPIMSALLTKHGASLTETMDYPTFDPPYKEFTITFPPGTVRSFGLTMMRSRYFVITFPDGYELHGGEMWPLARKEHDRATTILHLPQKLAEKKGPAETRKNH